MSPALFKPNCRIYSRVRFRSHSWCQNEKHSPLKSWLGEESTDHLSCYNFVKGLLLLENLHNVMMPFSDSGRISQSLDIMTCWPTVSFSVALASFSNANYSEHCKHTVLLDHMAWHDNDVCSSHLNILPYISAIMTRYKPIVYLFILAFHGFECVWHSLTNCHSRRLNAQLL